MCSSSDLISQDLGFISNQRHKEVGFEAVRQSVRVARCDGTNNVTHANYHEGKIVEKHANAHLTQYRYSLKPKVQKNL
jgi:hypothetical protein